MPTHGERRIPVRSRRSRIARVVQANVEHPRSHRVGLALLRVTASDEARCVERAGAWDVVARASTAMLDQALLAEATTPAVAAMNVTVTRGHRRLTGSGPHTPLGSVPVESHSEGM